MDVRIVDVSGITWQRGGGGLGAGGAEQLDVRGMKPASLPLLASSLRGGRRAERIDLLLVELGILSRGMRRWIDPNLQESGRHRQRSILNPDGSLL